LLGAAKADFLAYIALIAFGGVSAGRVAQGSLTWDAIDFERGTIIIPAAIAKTGRKRKLDMAEKLAEWLALYCGKRGV
jgi:integrase